MKKKNLYISGMKSGEKVSTSFLVSEKNLAYSQKGAPYLNLRLKDKTGELDGKVWRMQPNWTVISKREISSTLSAES